MKIIATVGDVDWAEHGGGVVFEGEDGFYLEYTHGAAADEFGPKQDEVTIYQVHYESETEVPDMLDWVKWLPVVEYCCDGDMPEGSDAIMAVGLYHGWHELDSYPITRSVEENEKAWAQ